MSGSCQSKGKQKGIEYEIEAVARAIHAKEEANKIPGGKRYDVTYDRKVFKALIRQAREMNVALPDTPNR